MARSGIGQDGYFRVQKEVTYGTALTNNMTAWPNKQGAKVKSKREQIENDNIISSRLKQIPNLGREVSTIELSMDCAPTIMGQLLNFFMGAASTAIPSDGAYGHTWLMPISGEKIGYSFTAQQALGADLADTYSGVKIHELMVKGDSQGNVSFDIKGTCKGVAAQGVARISSFAYPTATPFNFSMPTITIDPSDAAPFSQLVNSFEITLNLGLAEERFKVSSFQQSEPLINTIPSVMFKVNIDAEKQFVDAARAQTTYKLIFSMVTTQYAAGTTPFLFEIEIPRALLDPETDIENNNDTLSMDLDFNCGYGGTTTGSGSASVMAEIRMRDAVAAYA